MATLIPIARHSGANTRTGRSIKDSKTDCFSGGRCGSIASRSLRMVVLAGSQAMVANFRSVAPALAWILTLGLAGLVSAQPPAPTADRPHLAKDAKEAMDFLGTWARVTSGEDNFKGATYVGSESCKGGGCHDQQLAEWRTTWHSKILTLPSTETVTGNFNNAVIPFQNVRAVAKGHDPDLAKLQNV